MAWVVELSAWYNIEMILPDTFQSFASQELEVGETWGVKKKANQEKWREP